MICATCEQEFTATRKWQRFCSLRCRRTYNTSLKPEALRRDLDAALVRIGALERRLAAVARTARSAEIVAAFATTTGDTPPAIPGLPHPADSPK